MANSEPSRPAATCVSSFWKASGFGERRSRQPAPFQCSITVRVVVNPSALLEPTAQTSFGPRAVIP